MFLGTYRLDKLPITIAFYLYPLIGLISLILGVNFGPLKDLLWLIPFALLPLVVFQNKIKLTKRELTLVYILILYFSLKFFLPLLINFNLPYFYWPPFIMEIKGWFFLLFSYFWFKANRGIEYEDFVKGGLFLGKLYILVFFILIVTGNHFRFGLGSESNYDGILILLAYLACLKSSNNRKDKIILSLSTLITLSRTGIICWLVITFFFIKRKALFLIFLAPVFLFAMISLFISARGGVGNLENADRFIFWGQAFLYLKDIDTLTLLLGHFPGIEMRVENLLPSFSWYINHFGEKNNITGVHSFIFHGFWLRMAITCGIPFAVGIILWCVKRILYSKNNIEKGYLSLLILQGFSLALFHLTLVSIPLLLFAFMLYGKDDRVDN